MSDERRVKTAEEIEMELQVLSSEERGARRKTLMPDTSLFPPAMQGGKRLFEPGDKVIVERHTKLLGSGSMFWLDTHAYTVQSIDDETGVVRCLDEEAGHRSFLSFKDGQHRWFFRGA